MNYINKNTTISVWAVDFLAWSKSLPFARLTTLYGRPSTGSGPVNGVSAPFLASSSALLLPKMPSCPGIHTSWTELCVASSLRHPKHSRTNFDLTVTDSTAFKAAWELYPSPPYCYLTFPAAHRHSVTALPPPWCVSKCLLLINKDFWEVEPSYQPVSPCLYVWILYQEIPLLFISKSYYIFLFLFSQ